ncbi:MAG TPA: acetyl-CoA carboxylase biotin carboxylase subunit, partial [Armatimonadota bacterium]|nr:acetyl-CoA carboxylase biotin carboxylase subunit [Armatimonadota bacterium]
RMAHEAVCVGPPPTRESYTNVANIISAALITGAEAIHPGYGFLAENSTFSEACDAHGLRFIGPLPHAIDSMGDKATARAIMHEHGVPIVPGSGDVLHGEQDAYRAAENVGYPLMVKATAGGGGKGMRVVHTEEELLSSVKMAQAEAAAAFGNPAVYLERYIQEPRHVEIQVMADHHGNVVHLGERDCSVQTPRHQKMVEEAPCIALTDSMRAAMGEAAVRAAQAVQYRGAGTIEFLLDGDDFYFMEMNTRIQVEHPVTEVVTGIDLVKEQIRVASGEKLGFRQEDVRFRGHAIEVRLTAEDAEKDFTPSGGQITQLSLPGGFGVRVDTHIYAGYTVPPYYDSLLCKLIAWGRDRDEAVRRMTRCLDETEIHGIPTTLPFHRQLIRNEFYRRGEVTTNFIRRRMLNPSSG